MSEYLVGLSIKLLTCCCTECGITYAMPDNFKKELRESHKIFYCPSGHAQWFPHQTESEKLQKELKRKEQELANKVIEKLKVENELKKTNRSLNRLKKGVCPCCNRTFTNLSEHLKTQHPRFIKR